MLGEVPSFSLPSTLPNLPMVADISWNGKSIASGLLIFNFMFGYFDGYWRKESLLKSLDLHTRFQSMFNLDLHFREGVFYS